MPRLFVKGLVCILMLFLDQKFVETLKMFPIQWWFSVFFRNSLEQNENTYHHLGIYCFQKEILKKFVSLNQSQNEIKNSLEQLRALDNNIKINVALAKSSPIGVDTEEDLVAIKKIMEYKS